MSGVVNKLNFFQVLRTFGLIAAIKLLFSREKTFLDFCRKQRIV